MKCLHVVPIMLAVLFIASCKREDDNTDYDLSKAKVHTITHSATGETETYLYDNEGRITQLQLNSGSKTTYTYNGDTLVIVNLNSSGGISSTETMLLSNGLAQSSVVTDDLGNITGYKQYVFSGDEQTSYTALDASMQQTVHEEWIWQNGSITTYSIYDSVNTNLYNIYYWYNYPGASSTGKVNTGRKYLGADPIYQIRKILTTGLIGNTYRTLEYTTDDQSRVTSALYYNQNHVLENTDSYTYY